ncbi:MAG: N-acetylneuraminate synthase [Deltaproteobacteria bacterium]|nr:N-acetylneuraminate synthase [Deltaproteobacteria bacterium]
MAIQFGGRCIGDGFPCFVVYEAGPTHCGLESAKDLVRLAAEAGADAVKFQIFDPDRLVADKKQLFSYEVLVDRESGRTENVAEPLYDILARRSMSRGDWKALKHYSDELGLAFFSTVGFKEDVDLLVELGCHSVKIASADINHFPLLAYAGRSGMSVQIDTGNATLGEVESAVDVLLDSGCNDIIIHHCPSGYPARLESINLRVIPTLKAMFGLPVAYSDHTPGWDMDIAAVTLGANMVEKTITHDRMTKSVEHIFSLEPADMRCFIRAIRELEIAMGNTRKQLSQHEKDQRNKIRRSAHLISSVDEGDVLTEDLIEFRRPGTGLPPNGYKDFLGKRFAHKMEKGAILSLADLK